MKDPIDYIHQRYCCLSNGEKYRRLYAYGVSLGASLLTNYLQTEGERSPLSGACSFGSPYNLRDNVPFFKKNGFRFYDFSMGHFYYKSVLVPKYEELKAHVEKEKLEIFYQRLHENRFSMMDMD